MVRWQIASLLGLAASVAITGLALVAETGDIEADLAGRAGAVLDTEATSWATLAVSGRTVAMTGDAPTLELREMAVERVDRLFGVRSVDAEATTLLPEMAPYRTVLSRRGGVLTISGHAPSRPDRGRMVAALTTSVPNLAYEDDLQLARGMPDKAYLTALDQLYPMLDLLRSGEIVLQDQTVSITGEAATNAAYDRLRRTTPALPAGYAVTSVDVTRPSAAPFLLTAVIGDGILALSGFAPDPESRGRILTAARTNAPGMIVRDGVDLASGEPTGFVEAVAGALDFADLMDTGQIVVRDDVVSVQARAASPEAYRTLNAHIAAWAPPGFTVEAAIDLPIVQPFTFSAAREGGQVTVSGFVPSAEVNQVITAAAERVASLRGAVVETTLADGAPDAFEAAATFAIGLLEHVSSGAVTVVDGRIVLVGVGDGSGSLLEIEAALSSETPEGFTATSTVTPPTVAPYVWQVERTADSLVLTGYVTSEAMRGDIRRMAEQRAGDLGVVDRTTVAGGEAPGLDLGTVAGFALDVATKLDEGKVSLRDATLSLAGSTSDAMAGRSIRDAFETRRPAGTEKGTLALQAPAAFQMRIDRRDDALAISGTVSGQEMANAIGNAIDRSFGRVDASVELSEASGLPEAATEAALLAIRAASLLSEGTVTIEGPVLTVNGRAFTGVGAVRLSSDIAGAIPSGFRLDTSIRVAKRGEPLDGAGCQAEFDRVLGRNTILFETGSAAISEFSHGLLDRLGAVALRCPDAGLVIEGYPDAEGDAAANRTLSEERAKAVATIMEQIGVKPDRLQYAGYGADRPVADNTTPEGMARNRRIEIRVETEPPAP